MLSDERQILNLLHRYCELQDAADFVGVAELFRHSSYIVAGGQSHFGYDEVYALKTKHDRTYDDGTLRTKHVTTNTILELDENGLRATARSYFTVLQQVDDHPLEIVIAGRYHDRFACRDGTWHLTERIIYCDLIGDLSRHLTIDPFRT